MKKDQILKLFKISQDRSDGILINKQEFLEAIKGIKRKESITIPSISVQEEPKQKISKTRPT